MQKHLGHYKKVLVKTRLKTRENSKGHPSRRVISALATFSIGMVGLLRLLRDGSARPTKALTLSTFSVQALQFWLYNFFALLSICEWIVHFRRWIWIDCRAREYSSDKSKRNYRLDRGFHLAKGQEFSWSMILWSVIPRQNGPVPEKPKVGKLEKELSKRINTFQGWHDLRLEAIAIRGRPLLLVTRSY